MKVTEVITRQDREDFLKAPLSIYKSDPYWVRPLDQDIEAVFDPAKNSYFSHGEATRWVLKDEHGRITGRVAAFINYRTARTFEQPTGGIGFFECVRDPGAAFLLFDTCKAWLAERGMEAMDGPVNFGEKDKWWGLIVDGFAEPTYTSNYNPPYYRDLFERYGFQTYYEQYYYQMKTKEPQPPRFEALYQRILRNPGYSCAHIRRNSLDRYAEEFRTVYNKAWGKHDNFKEMTPEQSKLLLQTIKPIMDEDLIWFAYYYGEPIGFFVMLPELNQVFRHLNGKLDLFGKLKFVWYRWRKPILKIFGVVFGVVPEHQGKGIESLMIITAGKRLRDPDKPYTTLEMTWIGDFNPKMISMVETLGATRAKTYITYRKLFDESKPFLRAPII